MTGLLRSFVNSEKLRFAQQRIWAISFSVGLRRHRDRRMPCGRSACTDTVYKDRPPFNPPPDANSGFLGYFTAAEQQTTCGNCHVGQQADWIQTRHATAWEPCRPIRRPDPSCEGCHTVNSRGNQATASVGYDAVKDPAYYDVQCESCHGAGYDHVQNPTTVATRPIPSHHGLPP